MKNNVTAVFKFNLFNNGDDLELESIELFKTDELASKFIAKTLNELTENNKEDPFKVEFKFNESCYDIVFESGKKIRYLVEYLILHENEEA